MQMIMYKCRLIIVVFFILISNHVLAGSYTLRGVVVNAATLEPVTGARITSQGRQRATLTDSTGSFSLKVMEAEAVISVQCPGFIRRRIELYDKLTIRIYLSPEGMRGHVSDIDLPEITRRREDRVGSSRIYNTSDASPGATFADDILPGIMPGLMVKRKSGMPGEGNFIGLRGLRSLAGSNTPLIVVDGMPMLLDHNLSTTYSGYSRNILSTVMAKDVTSVKFIKGFDALSYGTMGANGVLMFETDKATDMQTKVEFETKNGVSVIDSKMKLMNSDDFSRYLFDIGTSTNTVSDFLSRFPFMSDRDTHAPYNNNTDWLGSIYSPAFSSENILKIKGSDAIAKYIMSAGYLTQNGVVKNTDFSKYFIRINSNMTVTERLDMFVNAGFDYYNKRIAEQGMVKQTNPMLAAISKSPFLGEMLKDDNGVTYNVFDNVRQFGISNPAAIVNQIAPQSNGMDLTLSLGLNAQVTNDIKLYTSFGLLYNYNREDIFIPGLSNKTIAPLEDGKARNTIRNSKSKLMDYHAKLGASYSKEWSIHALDVVVQGQMLFANNKLEFAKGINTPTDFDRKLSSVSSADGRLLTAYDDNSRWVNIVTTARYSYHKQLYVGVGTSLDGSSMTGLNASLMRLYPAANLGWKIDNSPFLRSADWLDDLTLRTEYVAGGNSRMPAMIGKYYYQTYRYNSLVSLERGNIPNLDIKPERFETYNLGVDFSIFGNRLVFSADVFSERTSDMIVENPLNDSYGTKFRHENSGTMGTKGFELSLSGSPISTKSFEWFMGVTFSKSKSKIKSLGDRTEFSTLLGDGATIITRVGESPYMFYGYQSNGVLNSTAAAAEADLTDFKGNRFNAGDIHFTDRDNNGVINSQDMMIIGDPTPNFFGGIFTSLRYKNLSLNAQFTYSYGNDIYNAVRRSAESMTDYSNQTAAVNNRWIHDGQRTNMPQATYGDNMGNSRFSSRWIEDGSYLKLKNLTLNYNYNKKLGFLTGLQIYVSADNLFCWSKYLGEDPEFSYSYDYSLQGVDYGKIPIGRSLSLGLKFSF